MKTKGNKIIFLIGSGKPEENFEKRQLVQEALRNDPFNYSVFLMETYADPKSMSFTWTEKFLSVLENEKPDLICAIFPSGAKNGAVEWEMGVLANRYRNYEEFIKKVVLTLQNETQLTELSFYCQQFVSDHTAKFMNWTDLPSTIDKLYQLRFY